MGTTGTILVSEVVGTAMLTLLGCGVVANNLLKNNKGQGGGWLMVNFGWGLGVFAGVYAAYQSGGHLNPAVTFGILASGAEEYADGIPVTLLNTVVYIVAEVLGAFLGAVLCWLAYKQHFDDHEVPEEKLGVFSTGPQYRNPAWNTVTEIIATFVLVLIVIVSAGTPSGLGPLMVALIVVGIGASIGGPTGYAINPARDLGPRIAHALLPIKGKGSSDWAYSWIPIVGPIIGGILGGLVGTAMV